MLSKILCAAVAFCSVAIATDGYAQVVQNDVIVESLPELSLNVAGTRETQNPLLWSGTPAQELLSLLRQAGQMTLSPAKRALLIHLMLLDLSGSGLNDPDGIFKNNRFFVERLRVLEQQGAWDELLALIGKVPFSEMTPEIIQIRINALMMRGDTKQACSLLNDQGANVYFDKMRISCFLAQEEKEKAVLAYDVFQDAYPESSPFFFAIADRALRELPAQVPEDAVLSEEDVYVYSLVKAETVDWAKQSYGVKKTLSELPSTDILTRISLGERLGLSLAELQRLYRLPLFNADLNNPVVTRVMTYRRIGEAETLTAKKEAVIQWLSEVKKAGLFVSLAPLISETLYIFEPFFENQVLALDAARSFVLTNDIETALAWAQLIENGRSETEKKAFLSVFPLFHPLDKVYPYEVSSQIAQICAQDTSEMCQKLRVIAPRDVFALTEGVDLVADQFDRKERHLTDATQAGANFLRAIIDIQSGRNLSDAYRFIQEAAQPETAAAILREEMIF